MDSSSQSEDFGHRALPNIVDERARSGYGRPVAIFPKSRDISAGFQTISYAQLANAVNRVCWWIEEVMLDPKEKGGAFAYFGPNDLRYLIFVLATMKTGRKILIASLRNTIQAQLGLFERANCKVIVSCQSLNQSLQPLFAASPQVRKLHAPRLDDILAGDAVPHFAFHEPLESAENSKVITLHTSGSSGNPKPIIYTHEMLRFWDAMTILPSDQGESISKVSLYHQNALSLLPCFHAGGLGYNMFAVWMEMTLVQGHPDVPMTVQYVGQLLKTGVVTTMLTPPSILEELADDLAAQQDLVNVKHIGYAGGPLRPTTGEKLAKIVPHLFSYIGATECGWFHHLSGNNDVWDSIKFYSHIGYRFDEISAGIFELVIDKDDRTSKYQPVFQVFPGIKEYRTRDLYSANANAPGWWKYRGRADDLIVLSNGEKINPIPMENIIRSHPSIKGALIIGEYRFIPSLLIELDSAYTLETERERHQLLDDIWPAVQEANKVAPGFSKIPKSLILFADPGKPFLRAGKGTIQRQQTVRDFAEELEHLYRSQEAGLLTEGLTLSKSNSPVDILTFVKEIYAEALDADDLSDTENVFQRGLDSLRVIIIMQRLRAALALCEIPIHTENINPRLVYSAWSVERMANAIVRLSSSQNGNIGSNGGLEHRAQIASMIQKYTRDMPSALPPRQSNNGSTSSAPWSVILTGTTGSLGSYLLAQLDALPLSQVSRIYCLNRSADARERQEKSNRVRGLKALSERVEFLQADFAQQDLGLCEKKYEELLREAAVIIHSAWKVNFNLTLESFDSQIKGVRNFLDFGANSAKRAPVIFISSISTALKWLNKHPSEAVPEEIIQDFDAPEHLGYGESKFVSEHLLDRYSKDKGLTTAVFRTGQIAGPLTDKGAWNSQEWFPSLVASSKHLGAVPETLGSMEVLDWLPVDLLSTIILELVEKVLDRQGQISVYNLINPKTTTWCEVRQDVQKFAGIGRSVPLKAWVEMLEQSSKGAVLEANPAVKLLDFFRLLGEKETETESRYEVGRLVRESSKAAEIPAVSPAWLRLWIEQWKL
ncbi:related to nonribosomal peptide synthetase MxcG (component of the myxochelin iron transport regulon) [Phialocephala subalpina]|uniref:Related to nonribosomal peptide synthetase MxcG (Component of the myxochelin iron transport regulon) n=1 Tax=Phialocephala subalpina TaxID=576137 RepID=A0A1L7XD09_9HELO|nr:related to nonribosomal peptide synthetase MxcG (component of the myxochelin iron transport regulon) [Phialocephala subalpina]